MKAIKITALLTMWTIITVTGSHYVLDYIESNKQENIYQAKEDICTNLDGIFVPTDSNVINDFCLQMEDGDA